MDTEKKIGIFFCGKGGAVGKAHILIGTVRQIDLNIVVEAKLHRLRRYHGHGFFLMAVFNRTEIASAVSRVNDDHDGVFRFL